jgi:hypothetical protein
LIEIKYFYRNGGGLTLWSGKGVADPTSFSGKTKEAGIGKTFERG